LFRVSLGLIQGTTKSHVGYPYTVDCSWNRFRKVVHARGGGGSIYVLEPIALGGTYIRLGGYTSSDIFIRFDPL